MSKFLTLSSAAMLLIAAALTSPASAEATSTEPPSVVAVKPFDVFVEPASRYVFVKLPAGWKFVGSLSEADVRTLPPTVLTSLLLGETERQAGR